MTIDLSRDDFRYLVNIVRDLPEFRTVDERISLMLLALRGTPRANDILASIKFDGTSQSVAVQIVEKLAGFGQVVSGREALSVFVNQVLDLVGEGEQAQFLRKLFEKYPLDVPVAADTPISDWRGQDSWSTVEEKIIGENTLRDIFLLEIALIAAAAVVHIHTPNQLGTGFMISPNLLMTNHHVIESDTVAQGTNFTFNFQLDSFGAFCPTQTVGALLHGVFYANTELDYAVVELDNPPNDFTPLRLRPVRVNPNDRVAIIQHPGGHVKKISMQNNFVAYADASIVQYTTSTLSGSSGSPVFDDNFDVVAIHHGGGNISEPGTRKRFLRNEGTSMIAIMADLEQNFPEILYLCTFRSRGESWE